MHAGAYRLGRGQCVATGRQLYANAGGWFAVEPRRSGVGLGAEFDARHVFQAHGRAVGVGAQHDIAKLLDAAELAIDHHGSGNALAGHVGQAANFTGRHLGVLRPDGGGDFGGSQVQAHEFGWVNPDAHGAFGAKQLHLADTRQTLYFRHDGARGVITQRDRIQSRVVRRQNGKQQEVVARLVHAHALLRYRRGQTRRGA